MARIQRCLGLAATTLGLCGALTGCGDDAKPKSFSSITKEIDSPTGTVDATTAAQVGEKFETASSNTLFGVREKDQVGQSGSYSQTLDCPAGGSYSVTGSGNQSSSSGTIRYQQCCFVEGCCASGNANVYAAAGGTQDYQFCAAFDMDYTCEGSRASVEYSGCYGAGGEAIVLIEVDGESFAVSGSRNNGTGTLEIRGANGTWSCSYTASGGSCSGSGGASFTFTSSEG